MEAVRLTSFRLGLRAEGRVEAEPKVWQALKEAQAAATAFKDVRVCC